MSSSVAVLIPYRPDGGIRDEICSWTTDRILSLFPDFSVYFGECDEGPFNRSQAINRAFKKCSEDILFITDSDTLWYPTLVRDGIASLETSPWTIPYDKYCKIDQQSSYRLRTSPCNRSIIFDEHSYDEVIYADVNDPYRPPCSGAIFMTADNFRKVGGFDEGFIGWGYEDVAFVKMANHKIGSLNRLDHRIYHLWHPTSTEISWESDTLGGNHWRFHLYNEDITKMEYDYLGT